MKKFSNKLYIIKLNLCIFNKISLSYPPEISKSNAKPLEY